MDGSLGTFTSKQDILVVIHGLDMLNEILDPNPPTSPEEIARFEASWKITLPQSYRRFLLSTNGGEPIPAGFSIQEREDDPEEEIQAFFGLKARIEGYDLDWVLRNLGYQPPTGILPIACTGSGDYLCIDTNQGSERIVFWDRLSSWRKDTWKKEDFFPVVDSFEGLLNQLEENLFDEEDTSEE